MNVNYSLDKIVTQIECENASDGDDCEIVKVDIKKKKIAEDSIWNLLNQNIKCFAVYTNEDPQNVEEIVLENLELEDFESNTVLPLKLTYKASCDPGQGEEVVRNLCMEGRNPLLKLNNKIKSIFLKFVNGNERNFLQSFSSVKPRIEKHLRETISETTGLRIIPQISIPDRDIRPIKIRDHRVKVRLHTTQDDIELVYDADLIVIRDKEALAVARQDKVVDIKYRIAEHISDYFEKNISIEEIAPENWDSIVSQVEKDLLPGLEKLGRTLSNFIIRTELDDRVVEENTLLEIPLKASIDEKKDFIINNSILLTPKNLKKYREHNSPNLKEWCKLELAPIIRKHVFNKTYTDLLIFNHIAVLIKNDFSKKVGKIGFSIEHMISIPDLEQYELLKEFRLEVENEKYETRETGSTVNMRIHATVKFNDFEKIKHILKPGVDIKEMLRTTIDENVQDYLHTISPERFYMEFGVNKNSRKPVQQELKELVKKVLQENYSAEVISVNPIIGDTNIILLIKKYQRSINDFELKIQPIKGREPLHFEGTYAIDGVAEGYWNRFESRRGTLEEINRQIVRNLKSKLESREVALLQYQSGDHQSGLLEIAGRIAYKVARELFGIHVRVTDFYRKQTDSEVKYLEAEAKKLDYYHDQFEKSIKQLKDKERHEDALQALKNQAELKEVKALMDEKSKLIHDDLEEEQVAYLEKKLKEKIGDKKVEPPKDIENAFQALSGGLEAFQPLPQHEKNIQNLLESSDQAEDNGEIQDEPQETTVLEDEPDEFDSNEIILDEYDKNEIIIERGEDDE